MMTTNYFSTNAHIRRDVGLSDYQAKPMKRRGVKNLVKSVKAGVRKAIKKVAAIAQPVVMECSAGV